MIRIHGAAVICGSVLALVMARVAASDAAAQPSVTYCAKGTTAYHTPGDYGCVLPPGTRDHELFFIGAGGSGGGGGSWGGHGYAGARGGGGCILLTVH
ncbi:hypothetical protein ACFV6D_11850 [Kitasatospora sp. NPDC059812]|uniref:hypothetical protein n=1 Tax=Kitasatospora sp. NPDC059812 TaxID=3346958 RepID=UPI00366162B1